MASALPPAFKLTAPAAESGLNRFFRWWGRELAWFVPEFLKERGLPSARMVWLGATAGVLQLNRGSGGKLVEVGRVDLGGQDAVAAKIAFDKAVARAGLTATGIAVAGTQILRKRIALPLLARDNLEQVLRFEMDRQTPFRPEQVYFHYQEAGFDDTRVFVDLAVLPRQTVDAVIARAAEWGVPLYAIAAQEALDGGRAHANFLPAGMRPATGRVWPWLYALSATLTLLLVAALLLIPLWQKSRQADELQTLVSRWAREARAVSALKDELAVKLARHQYLIEKRLTTTPAVAVLEEVSRLLPDSTWLQSLEIHDKELTLTGETQTSSRLVGLFAQSRLLGEANHKSPLVKVQNNLERFQLAVDLKPVSVEEAIAAMSSQHTPALSKQSAVRPVSRQEGQP